MAHAKATDDRPALDALRALGYTSVVELRDRAVRSYYRIQDPTGRARSIHIQKSGSGDANGRHRYGITKRLHLFDDVVFWAKDERVLLIIPTSVLSSFYHASSNRQITPSGQWVVNIYFDINNGNQMLSPARSGRKHSVSQYAHRISRTSSKPALNQQGPQPPSNTNAR